jgi:chromosome partitioning protein
MKAITFVTQKGGSGKSTLCISLAVAAQEAGQSVCILEMDRQATVSDWAEHRKADTPEVAQIDATQLDDIMTRLRDSDFDYVFIDTPGVDSPGTLAAIRAADLCVIPCRPTPADLRAFKPTLAAIYRLEKKFAFVLNQTPPRSYRVRDAADGLAVLGVLPDVNIVGRA